MQGVGLPTFAAEREGADAFVRRASTTSVTRLLCLGAATAFMTRTPVKVDVANMVALVAWLLTGCRVTYCRRITIRYVERNLISQSRADSSIRLKNKGTPILIKYRK